MTPVVVAVGWHFRLCGHGLLKHWIPRPSFQTRFYHPALAGTPPEEGNWNYLGGCSRRRSTACIHAGESAQVVVRFSTVRLSSPKTEPFGYRKVRYKGLAKNRAQVLSLMALANIYLLRRSLMAC